MSRPLRGAVAASMLAGVLGLGLAPSRAHAQEQTAVDNNSTAVPSVGVGITGALLVPVALLGATPQDAHTLPLGYLVGGDFRLRFAQRMMFRLGAAYGNVAWYNGSATTVPLDAALRIDVVPIEGPVAFWIGAAARGAVYAWANGSTGTDLGVAVGVAPEVALEFTSLRRRGFELFARYNFGLLDTAAGASSPFTGHDPSSGLEIGIATHLYF